MSEIDKPIKPENPEETLHSLQRFKEDIVENRENLAKPIENFDELVNDETYQILKQLADITENDPDLPPPRENPYKRVAPSRRLETKEETEKKKNTIDFSKIDDSPKLPPRLLQQRANKAAERAMEMLQKQKEDLEMLIGGKWSIILGSIILLISITTLIRYGIEKGAITPHQRVLIGMASAITFVTLAFRFHQNTGLSSGLIIGGLSILYYTSHLSFTEYTFLTQQGAFVADILITGLAVFFVTKYDRKPLAIFALIGVYLTPFAVGIGHESPVELYTYLAIANIVMLAVAYYEKWYFINATVFIGTIIPFSVWVFGRNMSEYLELGLVFSTLIYLTFFVKSIVYSVRKEYEVSNQDYLIFYANTFFYFLFVYKILRNSFYTEAPHDYLGEFAFALGGLNALFAFILFRLEQADDRIWRSLVAIPLFLLTFFAPRLFGTASLNLYWAAESVFLIWLSQRGDHRFDQLRSMSAIALFLSFCMMLYAWYETYGVGGQPFFFNSAVYTSLFMIIALGVSILLLLRDDRNNVVLLVNVDTYASFLGSLITTIIWLVGNIELFYHNLYELPHQRLLINLFNTAFVFAVWSFAKIMKVQTVKNSTDYLMWFILGFYWLYGHFSAIELRDSYLLGNSAFYPFGTHYLNVIVILAAAYFFVKDTYEQYGENSPNFVWLARYASIVFVFHASIELTNLVLIVSYDLGEDINELTDNAYKTWVLMFWAIASFALMGLGMRYKIKEMRVISLALFVGILLKFFIFDFRDLPFLAELFSLILLGAMLIGIGMMYRHLAVLIAEGEIPDTKKTTEKPQKADPQQEKPTDTE